MIEGMPPKRREMSQFMAQELLYDYVNGNLDSARQTAVEKAIADYPDLEKELELIKVANDYCEKLSETKANDELIASLDEIQSVSQTIFSKLAWQHWPDALKWTTEALVLSSMVIAFTFVAPWEEIKTWIATERTAPTVSEPIIEKEMNDTENQVVEANDVEKKVAEPKVVKVEAKEAAPEPTKKPAPVVAMGTLHRMSMKISNIENRADEITNKILALGGKKAGRVRLGWRKPDGNYYHFSIPKNNMQQLSTTLGEYGPVRLSKHPHTRVMPEGVNRIILFIEDGPVVEPETAPVETETETVPVEESVPEAPADEQTETEEET